MKVQVPSTHKPKYEVDEDVPFIPINDLMGKEGNYDKYYVIGNGRTGMDAVLYLMNHGVAVNSIHWFCPNQVWLFLREDLQVGKVAEVVLSQADILRRTPNVDEFFESMENTAGIVRINQTTIPKKWRCATVSNPELNQPRRN